MQEKFRTFQVGKDMDPNFKFEFILKWQKKKKKAITFRLVSSLYNLYYNLSE